MPWPQKPYAAFIFDMDGTLINSIAAANRVWTRWARSHGMDPASVLEIMHGVRVIETMRRLNVPESSIEQEAAALTAAEIADTAGVVPINGAPAFLSAIPSARWAIATSAPRQLAQRRLATAGVPLPEVLVAAEDVTQGKPAPDCFLLAARGLGVPASECLVWEDTAAGVKAAEAAGADVMVISATHHKALETPHPVIVDYAGLGVRIDPTGRLALIEPRP